jgi:soluble lytic murein transglycosylase-like protein
MRYRKISLLICMGLIIPSSIQAKSSKPTFKKLVTVYVEQTYPKAKLITYIIQRESGFNSKAQSGSCVGLMQINTKVWFSRDPKYNLIKLGVLKSKADLKNWKLNIKAGVYILKHYNWNYRRYRGG